jgi:Gas vesicle protein
MSVEPRTRTAPTAAGGHEPANLGDILERVLDRGVVIVGDIRISLLDIELLTVKLRLLIASVDTARELGIDWWQHDPWLTSQARNGVPAGSRPHTEVTGRRDMRAMDPDDDGRAALPASGRDRSEVEFYDEVRTDD